MKYSFILFLLFLTITSTTLSQSGFKVIEKAKIHYKKGHFTKALKSLNKADKMNYGFCGNAWMGANYEINYLRAQIYLKQKKYTTARNCLDSIYWISSSEKIDSIKIVSYQLEYGAESIAKNIDTTFSNITLACDNYICYILIPILNFDHDIRLKINGPMSLLLIRPEMINQQEQIWINHFKQSANYSLLVNNKTNSPTR